MLRIVTQQHGDRFTLALHGSVAGEWVSLLDCYWQSLVRSVPSAQVTAELSDVSFIDRDGERLLERMWCGGVELVASGCRNRHVVARIRGEACDR